MKKIIFNPYDTAYKNPARCIKPGEKCELIIKIHKSLFAWNPRAVIYSGGVLVNIIQSEYQGSKFNYDIFKIELGFNEIGLYFYAFIYERMGNLYIMQKKQNNFSDIEIRTLSSGYKAGDKLDNEKNYWQITCTDMNDYISNIFENSVMYQIFPDRFYKYGNCDLTGKLEPYVIHNNLNDIPEYKPVGGEILNNDFYGGNITGITKKLDYLNDLGVNVIYLNPICLAYSNHRYDTADYKTIDNMLGTDDDFVNLCGKAKQLGIKIILDGVFSHTGSRSLYFDKNNEFSTDCNASDKGAYLARESKYAPWYNFENYPEKYESWWGIQTLPCVNELCDGFIDYIIRGRDSVIKRWIDMGISGIRLDVADELPDEFIEILHDTVKKYKNDFIIIGEVWEDASNKISYSKRRRYFLGSELDSAMNYPFRGYILDFLTRRLSSDEFNNSVSAILEHYPAPTHNILMNFLSTHDTPRVITELYNKSLINPHNLSPQTSAEYKIPDNEYNSAAVKAKLSALLLFTLPGMPCIYYGDETAMQGMRDPFNRAYFNWDALACCDNCEFDMLIFYKEIISIRKKYKPLYKGSFRKIKSFDKNTLVFERVFNKNKIFIILNNNDHDISFKCNKQIIYNFNGYFTENNALTLKKQTFTLLYAQK